MIEAYPLSWPAGVHRTPVHARRYSAFDTSNRRHRLSNAVAMDAVYDQVRLLLGRSPDQGLRDGEVIVSTNHRRRKSDGGIYASDRDPDDPGAAVYFKHDGAMRCVAIDRWRTVRENLYAIAKSIEAMRGLDRWGSSDMVSQAFTGFAAIPERTGGESWREVLGFRPDEYVTQTDVRVRYRSLLIDAHPDVGGSHEQTVRLNQALEQALEELLA